MKPTMRYLILTATTVLVTLPAFSQAAFDVEQLDSYFSEQPKVEVNLTPPMLEVAAGSAEDQETVDLLGSLEGIIVRTYPLSSALTDIDEVFGSIGRELESDDWQVMVRVRPREGEDGGENVSIYSRPESDSLGGLVVMTLDEEEDEATFVMISGKIGTSMLSGLSGLSALGQLNDEPRNEEQGEQE